MDELEYKQMVALRIGRNIAMATLRRMHGNLSDEELTTLFNDLLIEATPDDKMGIRDIVRASAREILDGVLTGTWP